MQGSEYGGGGKFFAGCKLIGAPNHCQIIAFLTLKTDNIAKLRIELKSILLEITIIKGVYIKLVHFPPKLLCVGGGGLLPPLPPPHALSSYAYICGLCFEAVRVPGELYL